MRNDLQICTTISRSVDLHLFRSYANFFELRTTMVTLKIDGTKLRRDNAMVRIRSLYDTNDENDRQFVRDAYNISAFEFIRGLFRVIPRIRERDRTNIYEPLILEQDT